MKQKFLALVEEVKGTGIVEALYKASNAEELTAAWQNFSAENQELLKKASEWGYEFKKAEVEYLFEDGESIEDPMEIVVTIRIAGNKVSECDVFEAFENLVNALEDLETDFANAVAECVSVNYIYDITAEDLFSDEFDDDANSGDDENEEEAETGEGNNDGEVDSDNGEEEAESDEESDADAEASDET